MGLCVLWGEENRNDGGESPWVIIDRGANFCMVNVMRRGRGSFMRKIAMSICGILIMVVLWEGDDSRAANATKDFTREERETRVSEGALIQSIGVSPPVGRLLLMRRGSDLCAVRFTEFHRGNDAKPRTWYHSRDESFYSEYDWYEPEGDSQFSGPGVETGHRTVDRQPLIGFARIGFQLGTTEVECGSLAPEWTYPTDVNFIEGSRYDYDLELAPTQWTEPGQINLQDPQLKWYRLNEDQPDTFIPLEELPSFTGNDANKGRGAD